MEKNISYGNEKVHDFISGAIRKVVHTVYKMLPNNLVNQIYDDSSIRFLYYAYATAINKDMTRTKTSKFWDEAFTVGAVVIRHDAFYRNRMHDILTELAQPRPIYLFHDIGENKSEYCMQPAQFEEKLKTLKDVFGSRFEIFFDDGRKGILKALPIMQKLNLKGTVFIVPKWVDCHLSVPQEEKWSEFLTREDIHLLVKSGWEIGSHSYTHRPLSDLPIEVVEKEFQQSQDYIQGEFGVKCDKFSFPYGVWSTAEALLAKKYYSELFSITSHIQPVQLVKTR